jgi:hypothetical protein
MSLSTVMKIKSVEIALGNTNGSTVSSASLVRCVASVNALVYVANTWTNTAIGNTNGSGANATITGAMTLLANNDYIISKYPGDLLLANVSGVNVTSVAFRE